MPAATVKQTSTARDVAPPPIDQSDLLSLLGYNCLQAYLAVIPVIKKQLAKHSLRPVEFTVLSLVKANPQINQKRLGQTINVSPPNLATLLDRMEADGLLVRQRNPLDKRSQILALTQKGAKLCAKAQAGAEKLEAIPQLTKAERMELMRLLQKVFLHDNN
ncbi:MAG TPA: MarR family transcriptional regulator [Eoetvoesiella sp.]|uniref:MarR family winged helix-turn-helix transcriptional regulator n=1 Tax=Eoetvoesiella sp. TaxID=1966355 RepID=UPI002CE0017F|nr:MarR family transcriptional regulator [Eoetvoesiella sp.]HWK63280.1 MarR family transcriptional regulator [Eoetvoesiella sp.]